MPGWNTWEPILLYGKPLGKQTHDLVHLFGCAASGSERTPCPKPHGWARKSRTV